MIINQWEGSRKLKQLTVGQTIKALAFHQQFSAYRFAKGENKYDNIESSSNDAAKVE